jgi:tRNA (cytidine/uridine-2'-O-)-methyltransferase
MFHVALYEPEIPPNTGNIIRLCANTGAALHLIEPLGYELHDRLLKRAGLDYHEYAELKVHANYTDFMKVHKESRLFALSTHGRNNLFEAEFRPGDVFMFGPETRGLPKNILESYDPYFVRRLPMLGSSRSLNLSNAVAVVIYEAWRQCGMVGGN